MPYISESEYAAPWFAPGPHWQTILPNITRLRLGVEYERERLELDDGDFLDLDFLDTSSVADGECLLLVHGLEGDSSGPYIKSFALAARRRGLAVAVMNLRGCSGEMNRLPRFYHSGATDDLGAVLEFLGQRCDSLYAAGFSLGGNVLLKLLGDAKAAAMSQLKAAVAYSVPCDLAGCVTMLDRPENAFYMRRFSRLLAAKIRAKAKRFPDAFDLTGLSEMDSFTEFDGRFTAPLNGFASAEDYWSRCSCLPVLKDIERPTLLINARNDPFLSESCYPRAVAGSNACFHFEDPVEGGHCGFPRRWGALRWHEERGLDFLLSAE